MSATATITTVLESFPAQGQQPPISELLPFILRTLSAVASFATTVASILFQFSKSITRGAFWPFAPVIPVASYILAPIFVFLSLSLDTFVLIPYRSLLYILNALYPIYVFCGVSFIISVIIGFGGRAMIAFMKAALLEHRELGTKRSVEFPAVVERKPSTYRRRRVKIEE